MRTNDAGIKLIKEFEGCRLTAYKCPAGVWTIGYGHTAGVKEGQKITQAQADAFLKQDLIIYENYTSTYTNREKLTLNENQFSALVSFCYNCGPGNLQKLIKGRNLSEIADAMSQYNKAAGKVLAGLTRRREAERKLFMEGYKVSYYPKYEERNFTQALESLGIDSSYTHRAKMAAANGITNYSGTASQNIKLFDLLKAGKLIKE